MAIACAKKPTPEECQQAVSHLFDIMKKEATEQMKQNVAQMGVPTSEKAEAGMAEAFKGMQSTAVWERVRSAHVEACQHQPQTRATCVTNATTIDELVKVCGMKPSPGGPRGGGLTIAWPD